MEVYLSAGCRVPRRIAGGDDRVQNTAGALGEGVDTGLEEDFAKSTVERRPASRESRSLLSPDGESQLSPDDCSLRFVDAGHDHSLLSGMVSDAVHRSASIHGLDVFDFQFLSRLAKGIVPENLAPIAALSTLTHVVRNRINDHEYTRCS